MFRMLQYYGQYQGFKGRFGQLPGWARFLVGLAALPGILLVGLSIVAFLVSLLALLLLTVPLYRLLCTVCGTSDEGADSGIGAGFGPLPEGMDVIIDPATDAVPHDARTTVAEATVVENGSENRPARRQIDVKIIE